VFGYTRSSRRLKHWQWRALLNSFLDISPSLHYLSFLILISIQYIPSMSQARHKAKHSVLFYCSLDLTCVRRYVRIFLRSEIEVRHINFQGKLDPMSKGSSVELYTLPWVSGRVYSVRIITLQCNSTLGTPTEYQVQHRYSHRIYSLGTRISPNDMFIHFLFHYIIYFVVNSNRGGTR
jgi:hypothetical protein